jgi:hypothetical protein
MTSDNISVWLKKFLKGELEVKNSGFGEVVDKDITMLIPNLKALTRKDFEDVVYSEGTDVFLYVYTSGKVDET